MFERRAARRARAWPPDAWACPLSGHYEGHRLKTGTVWPAACAGVANSGHPAAEGRHWQLGVCRQARRR
eukprot:869831-Lingulodinium_polyedra.AAC.1